MAHSGSPFPAGSIAAFAQRVKQRCRLGQAEAALSEVEFHLKARPNEVGLYVILAGIYRYLGHHGNAAGAYAQAARIDKNNPDLWFGMGLSLEASGEKKGAFQAYAKALSLEPKHAPAFFRLVEQFTGRLLFGRAAERLDAAPQELRQHPEWFRLRSLAAFEEGDYQFIQNPPAAHRHLLKTHQAIASLWVRAQVYDPSASAAQLLEAARMWDRSFGPSEPERLSLKDPNPGRPLHIGFVSSRMRRHSIGYYQNALMKHRPQGQDFRLHLFSASEMEDDLTQEMRMQADSFLNISAMKDEQSVEAIRAASIDILVDFNEFANDGRLGIFARRAAPIQVHFCGNSVTTGLRAMDYRFSDETSEPTGSSDAWSAEKIVRLDSGYHLFTPPPDLAELHFETPALKRGHVTFGAIHHLAKYNDQVLKLYARILTALPQAHLILARQQFEDALTVQKFTHRMRTHGIPLERVTIQGDGGSIHTLAIWHQIDCVLDSFPFSGDATLMDSLYAGVPAVTLAGDRLASRRAASMLKLIGCPEFIAETEDDYFQIAVALGSDIPRLNAYRSGLHERVKSSPICQHEPTVSAFYSSLRQIWVENC